MRDLEDHEVIEVSGGGCETVIVCTWTCTPAAPGSPPQCSVSCHPATVCN